MSSWTDDIPVCRDSGVGSCCNEVYKQDGRRQSIHPYADRTFRFWKEEYSLCLYGVFHGFNGSQAADFLVKRLPAELLLGQLGPDNPADLVKETIKQAFVSVDREYFSSIGETLAARLVLRSEELRADSRDRLAELDREVSSGCVASVALILDNCLYLANVGDCHTFLCHKGKETIEITSLTIKHNLDNEDEYLRLEHLGFKQKPNSESSALGSPAYTRCFGNYLVKGGFRDVDGLESCRDDPVIAEPEIQGPIHLQDNLDLLVITTKSVIDAVTFITGCLDPQRELCELLDCHLADNPNMSLTSVAQSVLDQLVRSMAELSNDKDMMRREDFTLLLRAFGREGNVFAEFEQNYVGMDESVMKVEKTLTQRSSSARPRQATRSSTTTESSGVYLAHGQELPVNEDGRIEPYVDFGPFYKLWPGIKPASTSEITKP